MKKLIILGAVIFSTVLSAKLWVVTTSCGVEGTINMSENATISQLTAAVSQYNLTQCGIRPNRITITLVP